MTSNLFPWCTAYELEDLPDYPAIAEELAFAGKLARAYDQRLTFHPSHFVKLAPPPSDKSEELLRKSLKELEVHSQARFQSTVQHVCVNPCVYTAAGVCIGYAQAHGYACTATFTITGVIEHLHRVTCSDAHA